jgi:bla regulator protein BlaR1
MILAWMVGATAFTALLGASALAAERALRAANRASRTPWGVAIVVSVVWPVIAPLWERFASHSAASAVIMADAPASASAMITQQLPALPTLWSDVAASGALMLWALISALLIARLLVAAITLHHLRRTAVSTMIDGEPVLVTETLGPAVIGLLQPRVAVPAWFMQLDAPLRALVLARAIRNWCGWRR